MDVVWTNVSILNAVKLSDVRMMAANRANRQFRKSKRGIRRKSSRSITIVATCTYINLVNRCSISSSTRWVVLILSLVGRTSFPIF